MPKKKPASAKPTAKKQVVYLRDDSAVAKRQPKTDLLILARLLREAGTAQFQNEDQVTAAHAILVKWADMESTGRLAEFHETQLQGQFLAEVFGDALGYTPANEGTEVFYQIQHHATAPSQTPDAVLGKFRQDEPRQPLAVVELKGPAVHLDRDRSAGRTAVDQCWDYLVNTPPACRWGVVSNIVSFRLYERDSTKRAYEHFTLQELRDLAAFRRFYALFHRNGLVEGIVNEQPRAIRLLRETNQRQQIVSDTLYESYSKQRLDLIAELHHSLGHPLETSVEMAQRLLDRIMFIAFCEDRDLLPAGTIPRAYAVNGFSAATNPRWQSFKTLFHFIDVGNSKADIDGYNGGLFARHPADDLELSDDWTEFFKNVSAYDFRDEVNLDVLGHLFERSITEIERLKETGILTGDREKQERYAAMPQSVKRKQLGIYYTPQELTLKIVQYTVDELIDERFAAAAVRHGIKKADAQRGAVPDTPQYWQECLAILRDLKIVDPACGSGAFLFQAYNVLEQRYFEVIGHLEKYEVTNPSGSLPLEGRAGEGAQPSTGDPKSPERRAVVPAPAAIVASTTASSPLPNPPPQGEGTGGDVSAEQLAQQVPHFILNDNLYGVDLSPEAVEITQLALWIRSATRGQTLATLSKNIVHGNSLVHDPAVHPNGFNWQERFHEVFNAPPAPLSPVLRGEGPGVRGFDCVIGNPPWERIKLQEREFFSLPRPDIATATNAARRRQLVAKMQAEDPALFERYQQAQASADALLTYCRTTDHYPLTGRGDINLYAVFAELAYQLVAPHGRVGLLTPSGIAMQMTTKAFFADLTDSNRLIRLHEFDNRRGSFFPDVHPDTQFVILNFGGAEVRCDQADFLFGAMTIEESETPSRHLALSGEDIRLLNPNTRTCPIFHTRRAAEITKAIYRRVPVLIDLNREGPTGNPWDIKFKTMFHQTNDAELFREPEPLKAEGFKLRGNRWVKGKQTYLPLYEAKMIQMYDHRFGTVYVEAGNWINQGQTIETDEVRHANPEFVVMPRYWAETAEINTRAPRVAAYLSFRDITNPTNTRTMISAFAPASAGYINTLPIILFSDDTRPKLQTCLQANFAAYVFDYVARQKLHGRHMNFFVLEQLPTLPPATYDKPCPWNKKTTLETWISERVLKLTCTAVDMLPLAEAAGFTAGSFQKEYGGRLNKWDLDAAFFLLYGINRDDAKYILSTFKGIHEPTGLFAGHASTADHILATYDALASA